MFKTVRLDRPFNHDGGVAFTSLLPPVSTEASRIFLIEDGAEIGSASAMHQDIRDYGGGRYSLWNGSIHFSASDSSDCNQNDREYQVVMIHSGALREEMVRDVEADNEAVLRIMAGNTRHNNSLISNFFNYYNVIKSWLDRNNIDIPDRILEIGSGAKPFTAIRFILEGAKFYVANDLHCVQSTFSSDFVDNLRTVCLAVSYDLWIKVDKFMKIEQDRYILSGLQACGGRSFEKMEDYEKFGFIHSTSVLEHVREPERIVEKMADMVQRGGHMFHSIDFRDHRDFKRPFEFLKLSAEEYAPIGTENRLRSLDWIEILESNGFEIIERLDERPRPEGGSSFFDKLEPVITEAMRAEFVEPFRSKELSDLSILCTHVLCRRK